MTYAESLPSPFIKGECGGGDWRRVVKGILLWREESSFNIVIWKDRYTMKRVITTFALLCTTFVYAQTKGATTLADSLLKVGTFKAVTIKYDYPKEVKQLQEKAITNLKNNPEWAEKYLVHIIAKGDKNLPYESAMGLSQQEFNYLRQAFIKDKDIIAIDTFNLTIKKANGVISFKADKKATQFNDLKINTQKQEIDLLNSRLTMEIKQHGQSWFSPKLFGFECNNAKAIFSGKGFREFAFHIGVNKGDVKPTLALLFWKGPTTPPEVLSIIVL
ncbi:MAG: hypothetical protein JWP69_1961 [Flaviaesturariibacter sp.]|nr:hypothetical protein [Flaviaesturariibacter sp.]